MVLLSFRRTAVTSKPIQAIFQALNGLTDFQRATVKAACRHLSRSSGSHGRHLVADEVGLGKTLVARGVIATMLQERLARGAQAAPFRVVYICSNLALARENVNKLAVFHGADAKCWVNSPTFGRLAELGLEQHPSNDGVLMELCSLTPATSFALTQGGGNARERYIIFRAVLETPYVLKSEELEAFFRMGVQDSWTAAQNFFECSPGLEQIARKEFSARMGEAPQLDARALAAARELRVSLRSWRSLLKDVSELADAQVKHQTHLVSRVRGRIRELFVESCAQNLKADLFILDEFQRFRDLVTVANEAASGAEQHGDVTEQQVIARRVLHEGDSSTLMLSATPFKALTHIAEEEEGKAHAQEFGELLKYLCAADASVVAQYATKREALLADILSLPASPLPANSLDSDAKRAVESLLRTYISRTERAGIEPNIERVFRNVEPHLFVPSSAEIREFIALDRLSEALKVAAQGPVGMDIMQLHKTAPWCLSFLGGYQLRESLRQYAENPEVAGALRNAAAVWLPHDKFQRFHIDLSRDAPSSRFKQVLETAAPVGAERLLWVPPSLPYYEGSGPFAHKSAFSKTLLFSSLVLAPRALSSFVSYECERRLIPKTGKRPHYFEDRDEYSRTFRFDAKSVSPAWGLVYPCAKLGVIRFNSHGLSLEEWRNRVGTELGSDFKKLVATYGRGKKHNQHVRWYTLAPLLLDCLTESGRAYLADWERAMTVASSSADTRKSQVGRLLGLVRQGQLELGQPPKDLMAYLVDLAIGGPGVCFARALRANWQPPANQIGFLASATDAALSFVDKMNRIESQRVLRAVCSRDKPWIAIARYGAMGNLQAVFDEYLHLLKSIHGTLTASVEAFRVAVGAGAVSITAQTQLPPLEGVNPNEVRFHCHYAVPLGNQKGSDEKGVSRITNARAAFNSPFWPFMLNSTSIGQEGLDFHWYCRRIVHWSLPSNPIDLEQREGRINRFKSLVVRQRVAQAYGPRLGATLPTDVWTALFEAAQVDATRTDLVPFWHSAAGTAQIERAVPAMPFSSERSRLDEILRILSLYRLSFGQPRQQELVENLLKRTFTGADLQEIRRALLIDLAPINYLNEEACARRHDSVAPPAR